MNTVNNEIKKGATDETGNEKSEFKIGESFNYDDFKITTSNKREVAGFTADDIYVVFDMTIEATKDNQTASMQVQGATATNNVVNSEIMLTNDKTQGDPISVAWTKNLSKGQKATGYVAFKKSDNVAKAEIKSFIKNSKVSILL